MDNSANRLPFNINGVAPYIHVFDMPVALAFYRDVLGFSIKYSSGEGYDVDWVLLQLNDIEFMLNTAYEKANRPAAPNPLRIDSHGDITFYFGCRETDALYAHLQNKGIKATGPFITTYGWKAIYLKDSDGYQLCFH
ncbi:VOC family protein [Mucilaginibacter flavus]|uniref:VOC family protein n=1 Tax=Mucilaginibacter flavus TaxID=931504 RepID=UPI0025B5F054|nr:VOC family protein [Mucilaginibacter flavus]MDN3583225.1 VOC family protein [Mucilaginibacter flavus]